MLNAVLFVLIGLEVLALALHRARTCWSGWLAIPIVLLARLVSVAGPLAVLRRRGGFTPQTTRVLTWGGLRGGISVALALSLPRTAQGQPVAERDVLLSPDLRGGRVLDPGAGADHRPADPTLAPRPAKNRARTTLMANPQLTATGQRQIPDHADPPIPW